MLLSYIRDFVPPFYFGLAVTLWRSRYADAVASSTAPRGFGVLAVRLFGLAVGGLSAAGTRMPWHPVPSRAASVYLQYGFLDLQSADFFRFFIRNLRYSFDLLSGFTRDEYHVIRVDFIVALRRTKGRGRRTLRSPPSPSSGLHLIHPGCPLRRGITAAAGLCQYWIPVSGADRLSPVPNVVLLSVFGLVSFAFQSGCWALVARFSLLGDRSFVPAATCGLAMFFRRICADRE